jgi:hypothetical protein
MPKEIEVELIPCANGKWIFEMSYMGVTSYCSPKLSSVAARNVAERFCKKLGVTATFVAADATP